MFILSASLDNIVRCIFYSNIDGTIQIDKFNECFLNSNTITNTIANIESSTIQLKSLAKLNTKIINSKR